MPEGPGELQPAITPRSRAAWRAWLEKNHEREEHVWLVSYKRHTGRPAVDTEDQIEEALCFGWIDSTIRRIDDARYARKFSRRRPGSQWSGPNVARVRRLIADGRMAPAGLAAFETPARRSDRMSPRDAPLAAPPDLAAALRRNGAARALYAQFPPGAKRQYHSWILNAKRPETRARRVAEAVQRIANNERTLLK